MRDAKFSAAKREPRLWSLAACRARDVEGLRDGRKHTSKKSDMISHRRWFKNFKRMKYSKGAGGCQAVFGLDFVVGMRSCVSTQLIEALFSRSLIKLNANAPAARIFEQLASLRNSVAMNFNRGKNILSKILRKNAGVDLMQNFFHGAGKCVVVLQMKHRHRKSFDQFCLIECANAAALYARIKPPVPNFVPPKYRVTTQTTFVRRRDSSACKMGLPAVPEGSPASLLNAISASSNPKRQAKQWCVASGNFLRRPSSASSIAERVATGISHAIKRECLTTSCVSTGSRGVKYFDESAGDIRGSS